MCSLEKRGKVYVLSLVGEDDEDRMNPTTFHALKEVEESPDAAALVTTKEGKHFSCGIDLKWMIGESPLGESLEKMCWSSMHENPGHHRAAADGCDGGMVSLVKADNIFTNPFQFEVATIGEVFSFIFHHLGG